MSGVVRSRTANEEIGPCVKWSLTRGKENGKCEKRALFDRGVAKPRAASLARASASDKRVFARIGAVPTRCSRLRCSHTHIARSFRYSRKKVNCSQSSQGQITLLSVFCIRSLSGWFV